MVIRKIARMGHPVLESPAQLVSDPAAADIQALIQDMVETMADAGGAGLAAPQVYVPQRLVIFFAPGERAGADDLEAEAPDLEASGYTAPLTVLINPEIEVLGADGGKDMVDGWEGCLSVPEMRGVVPRYDHIRYRGLDENGDPIEREARGFHARVVQHECDHLDGILYPQRMTDLKTLIFESELPHRVAPQMPDQMPDQISGEIDGEDGE